MTNLGFRDWDSFCHSSFVIRHLARKDSPDVSGPPRPPRPPSPDPNSSCFGGRFWSDTILMRLPISVALFSFFLMPLVRADGPSDNLPDKVRRIPPPGIKISETDRAELENGVTVLSGEVRSLRGEKP